MSDYDGIIVGGGHNGLACGAYLAKAGLRIAVVERNAQMGGGCARPTELTLPRPSTTPIPPTTSSGRARSPAISSCTEYGLSYVYPPVQFAMVFRDGAAVTIHRDPPPNGRVIPAVLREGRPTLPRAFRDLRRAIARAHRTSSCIRRR